MVVVESRNVTVGSTDIVEPASGLSISAVLPAYNEEDAIEQSVRQVAAVLTTLVSEFEVIVTNDGSKDRTAEVLARLSQDQSLHLRVVTHATNLGYGAALASGFDAASKELIFLTDGDRQFDVSELARFVPVMDEETDLVIGWRRRRADPPMRLLNAFGWKLLIHGLFGYTARDVDCAFKLFRRKVWSRVHVRARGATFSAEFLVKARRLGFQVKELPVEHFPRTTGSATGAKPSVIVRAFRELFSLWRGIDQQLSLDESSRETSRERMAAGQVSSR